MDINYQYNFEQLNQNISYRSGADPVIVNHKGDYYLFVTISGGYWRSKDLLNWNYISPSRWPMEDICAPAALSVQDTLYLFQSTFDQRPILFTTTPENGTLSFYNRWLPQLPPEVGPWDPALFMMRNLAGGTCTGALLMSTRFMERSWIKAVSSRIKQNTRD
jgi:hypothetical protein